MLVAVGAGLVLLTNQQRMVNAVDNWNDTLADMPNIGKVAIIMPALNEEERIETALQSLQQQNIIFAYPDYFQIIVVDSNSKDATASIASKYATVLQAPRGKLNAIDMTIRQVDAEIISAVDADSTYGCNFLNLLLKHFENPNVVGVSGAELYDRPDMAIWGIALESLFFTFRPRMMGRGCMYRKSAYYATGGFDLTINQQNVWEMMAEEEVGYWDRLETVGIVLRETSASVLTSSRRVGTLGCRTGDSNDSYCKDVTEKERF